MIYPSASWRSWFSRARTICRISSMAQISGGCWVWCLFILQPTWVGILRHIIEHGGWCIENSREGTGATIHGVQGGCMKPEIIWLILYSGPFKSSWLPKIQFTWKLRIWILNICMGFSWLATAASFKYYISISMYKYGYMCIPIYICAYLSISLCVHICMYKILHNLFFSDKLLCSHQDFTAWTSHHLWNFPRYI